MKNGMLSVVAGMAIAAGAAFAAPLTGSYPNENPGHGAATYSFDEHPGSVFVFMQFSVEVC